MDALAIAKFPQDRVDVLPLEDENNLVSVQRCLHQAFGKFPEADWIANVTGGLKPMSIAAYEFFKALDARIVYIDSRCPNEILGLDGQEHSDDPNQPLDKLEARIQQFRALRVNPVLATTSPKILDATNSVKATFAQRAAIYNCRIVTVHQIRELAAECASPELVAQILLNRK